jgi:hypothetical protein
MNQMSIRMTIPAPKSPVPWPNAWGKLTIEQQEHKRFILGRLPSTMHDAVAAAATLCSEGNGQRDIELTLELVRKLAPPVSTLARDSVLLGAVLVGIPALAFIGALVLR